MRYMIHSFTKYTATLLLFFLSITIVAQNYSAKNSNSSGLILSENQNKQWINHIDTLSISAKIDAIIKRMYLDTNIYVRTKGDVIKYDSSFKIHKEIGCCKPIVSVNGKILEFYYFKTLRSYLITNTNLKAFIDFLKLATVYSIDVLDSEKAQQIYGDYGDGGAILIKITDRKSKANFRKYIKGYRSFRG
jgi:hypothetical protein